MNEYFNQRRGVLLIGFLVVGFTTIPYLLGYAFQGSEWRFTGFLIGVEDGNSYIAKMLSGGAGSWLFRSPYSAEFQNGALIFLPYLLLGKLSAGPSQHEQLVALFHIYRVLAGLVAALAVNDFLTLYIQQKRRRLLALGFILVGGGFGWLITIAGLKNLLGSLPLDFLSPESFGFLGIFGLPHLALARALLLWGITAYLNGDTGYKAGLLWLVMGLFQPMNILVAWVVCGGHALLEWFFIRIGPDQKEQRQSKPFLPIKKMLQAGLVSSPMVLYNLAVFTSDPYLAAWTSQNRLPSPHWVHYLIAYAAVVPFAVGGIRKSLKINMEKGLLLAVWLGIFPFLVSAPVNPQRRLAEGIWVVLITGMFLFYENREKISLTGRVVLVCLIPSAFFLWWGASLQALNPAEPAFRRNDEIQAFQALAEKSPTGSIVLSTFEVGNALPAWAPVHVILGHGPETVNLESWTTEVDNYFVATQGLRDCGEFFYQNTISYLFWGPAEVQRWNWNPETKECLSEVYNESGYRIFRVEEP